MLLFNLNAAPGLVTSLARATHGELGMLTSRQFPDGETYLRVESDVMGQDVAVVCTLARPDAVTVAMLLLADTLRELGARRIGLVAPYLAYMRQDAVFKPGEGVTARHYARLLSSSFDWLVTVDPHLHRIHSLDEVYTIPALAVQAAPMLADWLRANVTEAVIFGPDAESEQWVADVAARAGAEFCVLEKTRYGDRDVAIAGPAQTLVDTGTPVLVDDIISTGTTLARAIEHLRKRCSQAPVCIGVHAIFAPDALQILTAAGAATIVTCNTIEHPSNGIDVTPALAQAVLELSR